METLPKLEEVIDIVKEAGEIALGFYDRDYETEIKADESPVTEADHAVNDFLLKKLTVYNFPILSEESADDLSRLESEYVWILDPIDGTKEFIKKNGEFSIMLALVECGESVLGVVYAPALRKLWYGERGSGSFVQYADAAPKKLKVSTRSLQGGRLLTSRSHKGPTQKRFSEKYAMEVIPTGSVGIKLGMIAEGLGEAYVNGSSLTSEWDLAAAHVILEEAGGSVRAYTDKQKILYNKREAVGLEGGILATNQR